MIICMGLATISFLCFGVLYLGAADNVTEIMLAYCCEKYEDEIKKIQIQMQLLAESVTKHKSADKKEDLRKARKLKKKMKEAKKMLTTYREKKIAGLDLIPVTGYRLMQLLHWDIQNPTVKRLYEKCHQYKEKRQAMNQTYYVLGNLFGFCILAVCGFFLSLGLTLAMGMGIRGVVIAAAVAIMLLLFGYLPYDAVQLTVNQRKEEIEHDFPQLVSQMTLLVIAGMEVNKAWNISSKGGNGTLYIEMSRVNVDLENNVPPMEAYGKFITRCSNKYTTKLATAIMQNLTKGNAEIANVFYRLNEESWSEYRHNARRMSERVSSKLFIPTMLMFVGILIMVIVPLMSGFSF